MGLNVLGLPKKFDPRRVAPGALKLWLDATRLPWLADGAAVTVWPDQANPGTFFKDDFTRADSATTLGNGWTTLSGTWGISANQAYLATPSGTDRAVRDFKLSDCVIQATFATTGNVQRLTFRHVDTQNELFVSADATQWTLNKRVANVLTTLGTYAALPANGDVVRVVLNGSSITVYINGTSRITATETFNQTATVHGMSTNLNSVRFDNFLVAKLTDAIQTTAASQPVLKTNVQNGKAVVRFDGVNDFLANMLPAALSQPNTVFLVAKARATGVMDFIDGNVSTNRYVIRPSSTTGVVLHSGTTITAAPYTPTNWNVYSVVFQGANTSLKVNGGTETTGNTGTNTMTGLTIGSGNTGGGEWCDCDIAEILVFNAALTTRQRRQVEKYLARKWGISLTRQVVEDTFTRPDSATTLENAETGQAWQVLAGTWGIASKTAYCVAHGGTNKACAVVETGMSDGVVEVTHSSLSAGGSRLAFRFTDVDNGFIVGAESAVYQLYRLEAGTYNAIGSWATTPASGDVVRVVMNGSSITVYINGTARITATSTFNQTATKHGIAAASTSSRFDNFTVEV